MKRRTIAALITGVVILAAGLLAIPRPATLSTDTDGDAALIEHVRESLPAGPFDRLGIAVVDGDDVSVATFGSDGDTEYEIGSVTKTFTASLYAIALERDEVETDSTLGELLGVTGAAASVTLEELATQHSGLPRLPASPLLLVRSTVANLSGADPYTENLDELIAAASGASVNQEKPFLYSNFGVALLGHALAAAASAEYQDLLEERVLEERVLEPLGLSETYAPGTLPADATTGFAASGRRSDPWTLAAYGPAGSIRSTLDDMTAYVVAQRDETAPGVSATEPRVEAAGDEIGYAWFTTDEGVVWHNGMTGGFASFVAFDRASGRAVVILSNSAVSLDDLGFELVGGDS